MSDKNLLITFGCSWTYGVGVNYSAGMSEAEFKDHAWNQSYCDKLSFRAILASKLGLDNINFSQGGSSNQRQFRLAKEFFVLPDFAKFKKKYKNIIVLWGITSTARNEMFDVDRKEMTNFFLGCREKSPIAKQFTKYSYDHVNEVKQLALEMKFWNLYFEQCGTHNFWFDTFNYHNYTRYYMDTNFESHYNELAGVEWPSWEKFLSADMTSVPLSIVKEIYRVKTFGNFLRNHHPKHKEVDRLIGKSISRDIASQLALKHGWELKNDNYHHSKWTADSDRIQYLTNIGLLNPWTYHPTKECHQEIAEIFEPYIASVLNKK
jgi:hypothetical protein